MGAVTSRSSVDVLKDAQRSRRGFEPVDALLLVVTFIIVVLLSFAARPRQPDYDPYATEMMQRPATREELCSLLSVLRDWPRAVSERGKAVQAQVAEAWQTAECAEVSK